MAEYDWYAALRTLIRDQPYPIYKSGDTTIPAASVWTGSRLWSRSFLELGVESGTVVGFACSLSVGALHALIGAFTVGATIAVGPGVEARSVNLLLTDAHTMGICGPSAALSAPSGNVHVARSTRLLDVNTGWTKPWTDSDLLLSARAEASPDRAAMFRVEAPTGVASLETQQVVRLVLTPLLYGVECVEITSSTTQPVQSAA
jgi:hypothetical protein